VTEFFPRRALLIRSLLYTARGTYGLFSQVKRGRAKRRRDRLAFEKKKDIRHDVDFELARRHVAMNHDGVCETKPTRARFAACIEIIFSAFAPRCVFRRGGEATWSRSLQAIYRGRYPPNCPARSIIFLA